jgi:hypothetical protein
MELGLCLEFLSGVEGLGDKVYFMRLVSLCLVESISMAVGGLNRL